MIRIPQHRTHNYRPATARCPAGYRPVPRHPASVADVFERAPAVARRAPAPKMLATGAAQAPRPGVADRAGAAAERAAQKQLGALAGRLLDRLGKPGQLAKQLLSKGLDLTSVARAALGFIPGVGPVLTALSAIPGVGKLLDKALGGAIALLKKVPGLGHVVKGVEKVLGWVSGGVGTVAKAVGSVAKKAVSAVGGAMKKVGSFFKRIF